MRCVGVHFNVLKDYQNAIKHKYSLIYILKLKNDSANLKQEANCSVKFDTIEVILALF